MSVGNTGERWREQNKLFGKDESIKVVKKDINHRYSSLYTLLHTCIVPRLQTKPFILIPNAHTSYCTDWLLSVCADTNTTNSRNTHSSASLQDTSSVHPLCATDCLQLVGLGVPPEHHLSLHLSTAFCLLHGRGREEGCVVTPSRYLQPPPAGDPTEQDSCTVMQ